MKVSCTLPLLTLVNESISHPNGTAATFASVATEALLSGTPEPDDIDGQKSYDDFKLAKKLLNSKTATLNLKEVARIREAVAASRSFNKLVVGRMFELLEGKSKDGVLES